MWAKLHRVMLDELGAAGALNWSRCAIDSVNVRATKGGLTGSKPVDRGAWVEDPLAHRTDRSALSVGISAASGAVDEGAGPVDHRAVPGGDFSFVVTRRAGGESYRPCRGIRTLRRAGWFNGRQH
nr:hypothetical protein GCM10010200_106470 [Actinomadura rugatobispora]